MKNKTENLQEEIDKQSKKRDKKIRPKMKISGRSVLRLKKIIEGK